MKSEIKSKALEVNLAATRNVEYSIPESHLLLLELSSDYWGIQNRMRMFLEEYHHPYSNRKEVINQLISVAISDFWIYKNIEKRAKVVEIFLEIFDTLLKENLSDEVSKHLIFTYLNFLNSNYDLISEFDTYLEKSISILDDNFEIKYFHYISNLGYFIKSLEIMSGNEKIGSKVNRFMEKLIIKNINFWDETTKIEEWYEANKNKMSKDYSAEVKLLGKEFFENYREHLTKATNWNQMTKQIFTFSDIIDAFRKKTEEFEKVTEQLSYIFYLIHLPGMVYHHNFLLIDLNKAIKRISNELEEAQIIESIDELFALFEELKKSNINYILDSILTLGKEILNTHNEKLIHYLEKKVIDFGFVSPGVTYLTNDWELKVDRNHIKNIRVWLELIEYEPEMMKRLLSSLIINLRVGGIFIFDTDLFQKDITQLLNSRISPIYKQIKQLTRLFPVYFNEIGAEGLLREVSTKVDELSQRNDKLIHFLRKQIHTEGNNSHIYITLDIIKFWYDLSLKRLKGVVPENVLSTIDKNGIWVKGVHNVLRKICENNNCGFEELLLKSKEELQCMTSSLENKNEENNDIKRVCLLIELYRLLKEKYSFEANNIIPVLRNFSYLDINEINKLELYLNEQKDIDALRLIFSFMVKLNSVIFDAEISEGWDNIYYKRHIAFGIPSMYGEYHEKKFEALGLTFRLERISSVLVSRIVKNINIDYFTAKSLKDIFSVVQLLRDGLSLDGISDQGLDSNLKMFQYSLTSKSFNIKQYINIFRFMEVSLKEIINKYFIRPYKDLLNIIIPQHIQIGDKSSTSAGKKLIAQKSEIFYRELLSSAFLVQSLDNLIGEILNNLNRMVNSLSETEIQNIMTYDTEFVISPLYTETPILDNQVFLGSKAYYLKKLYLNNFPVPPGFVLTTEVFRRINSIIKLSSLTAEIDSLIKYNISELERISGLKYGDPVKPLLLSVRSGAAISMPGAMNTFLNVGLNDEITENLSKQYNFGWTSWDCYRRLLQTWGMSYGLSRNDFDKIMLDYKQKYNITRKIDFSPAIMKEMAFAYKQLLKDNNIYFESDPYKQVKQAIISVFHSWNTPRAMFYRQHLQIADEWGTAVIVQQMVFGNLHYESGSGVVFTHNIQENLPGINLTGDFSFLSQGEDIVAGLINTLPISESQRLKYYQKSNFSLESAFPKIYNKLRDIAKELIEVYGFSQQEIEFTFETTEPKDLYILQTREMAVIKSTEIKIFSSSENEMKKIGSGIGIGNDVLNGLIVFDLEDLKNLKEQFPGHNAILVRPDTVPDDIEMIYECEGLLTGRGGATSHAAVTAATLGKICIVNCDALLVNETEKKCTVNSKVYKSFDPLAIDGNNGILY
nr:hypothetical protein [Bacteroidales bacterium]